MKLRHKKGKWIGFSSKFNTSALNEIIVGSSGDLGLDSDHIQNYDVYLESSKDWKDMAQAFKDHDLITNNFFTHFFEPKNDEDRKRGFTLT